MDSFRNLSFSSSLTIPPPPIAACFSLWLAGRLVETGLVPPSELRNEETSLTSEEMLRDLALSLGPFYTWPGPYGAAARRVHRVTAHGRGRPPVGQ